MRMTPRVLVRRYLEAFGTATAAGVARFALVQQAGVHGALRAVNGGAGQSGWPGCKTPRGTCGSAVPGRGRGRPDASPHPYRRIDRWWGRPPELTTLLLPASSPSRSAPWRGAFRESPNQDCKKVFAKWFCGFTVVP